MEENKGFVKGQKVLTPAGEAFVVDVDGSKVIVKVESGDTREFDQGELEDDSDAG